MGRISPAFFFSAEAASLRDTRVHFWEGLLVYNRRWLIIKYTLKTRRKADNGAMPAPRTPELISRFIKKRRLDS